MHFFCAADKVAGGAEGEAAGNIPRNIDEAVSVAVQQMSAIKRVSHLSCCRCVGDTLLGRPILQIPEPRQTEVVRVEFSPSEGEQHGRAWKRLGQLREQAKSGSATPRNGELRQLFNYLRYFTSHPALVEPPPTQFSNPAAQLNQAPQQHDQEPQKPQPTPQMVAESMDIPAAQYFCRLCCNVLVDPLLGKVSSYLLSLALGVD